MRRVYQTVWKQSKVAGTDPVCFERCPNGMGSAYSFIPGCPQILFGDIISLSLHIDGEPVCSKDYRFLEIRPLEFCSTSPFSLLRASSNGSSLILQVKPFLTGTVSIWFNYRVTGSRVLYKKICYWPSSYLIFEVFMKNRQWVFVSAYSSRLVWAVAFFLPSSQWRFQKNYELLDR